MKKHNPIEVVLVYLMIAALLFQPLPLLANPVGGTVVAGSAVITGGPGRTIIQQNSPRAIINWDDFSIGAGEITKFVQPSSSAAVLNRVIGLNPTKIYGTLEGNGHVYVINQNGILVGRSGVINTRSFTASTLDVNDAAFLDGGALRFAGESGAGIFNAGRISALGGDVFLIARSVRNEGAISAREGTVGLAAGSEVILQPSGSERISVVAGKPGGGTGVDNGGSIQAVSAELKAAGGNVYALAINNGGVIRGTSLGRDAQGRVVLKANGGNIANSGTIVARNGDGSGGTVLLDAGHAAEGTAPATVMHTGSIQARGGNETAGGDVRLLGDRVGVTGPGVINVSGGGGGGQILVGGDYQGKNPEVQNAQATVIGRGAMLLANGGGSGSGGRIIIWSDDITRIYGTIIARGGGGGGFIETSSKGTLDLIGAVVSAGVGGSWLLDPRNITIQDVATTAGDDSSGGSFNAGDPNIFTANANDAIVDVDAIEAALNGGTDVTITTAGSGAQAGDITVASSIAKTAGGDALLTLSAEGGITLNTGVSISSSVGQLGLTLTADSDNNGSGAITISTGASLASNGGAVTLAGTDIALTGTINSGIGVVTMTASNDRGLALGAATAGSDFELTGTELQNITTLGGLRLVTTGAGTVTVDGVTAGQSQNVSGVLTIDSVADVTFSGTASIFNTLNAQSDGNVNLTADLSTDSGALTLVADADNSGAGNIDLGNGVDVSSGGNAINLTAANLVISTGGGPNSATIASGAGLITITASADRTIGLGATAGDLTVNRSELGQITSSGGLRLVTTGTGTITVDDIANGDSAGITGTLTLDSSSTVSFVSNPSTFNILTVRAADGVTANRGIVTDSGALTIDADTDNDGVGTLTVAADRVLNSSGNALNIRAADIVLSSTGGDNANLNSGAGLITIEASTGRSIGLGAAAGDLSLGATELNKISSSGGIEFVTTGAGTITANGYSSSGISGTVTLDAVAAVTLSGAASTFGALDVQSDTGINLGVDVTTTGSQSYSGAMSLTAGVTLQGTTLTIGNVDGNSFDLALNFSGSSTLSGASFTEINNFSVGGGGSTTISAGTVSTTGTQTYDDAIVLGGDVVFSGTTVTFNSTVNGTTAGQESLGVTGNAVFGNGAGDFVGNTTSLEAVSVSGSTSINGGNSGSASITTSGAQTFTGAVTLGRDATLAGSTVTFQNTVNGTTAGQEGLTVTGNAVFGNGAGDFVGNTTSLELVSVSGSATFNAGSSGANTVTTTGTQTYGGAATLNGDTILAGSTVTFNGTVNGTTADADALSITGNAVFGDGAGDFVGNTTRIESLNVSGTTALNGGSTGANTVRTAAGQTYGSTVTLGRDTVLAGTTLSLAGVTGVANDLTLTFSSDVTLSPSGLTGIDAFTVNGGGNTILNAGTLTTTGAQLFQDNVRLAGDVTLSGSTVTFQGTVDGTAAGTEALAITGNAVFGNGAGDFVGSGVALEAVSVTGSSTFNAGNSGGSTVTTVGTQTYSGNATLNGDTTLAGSTVTFNGTVNGTTADADALTVTGNAVFGNSAGDFVGNSVRLESLSVSGTTALNGGNSGADTVRTAGGQNYGATVTLGRDTTLSGSALTLAGVTGGGNDLALNFSGDTTLDGALLSGIADLTVGGGGNTIINGGTITTTGTQTFDDNVRLAGDVTLSGTTVSFNGTVDGTTAGTESLVINGGAVFGNSAGDFVGNGVALELVTVSGGVTFNAGSAGANTVTTAGAQTYGGAAVLNGDTVLAGTTVTFNGTVNGTTADADALSITGDAVFGNGAGDFVGNLVRLEALSVTGTAALNGGSSGADTVSTAGNQTYGNTVTLGGNTVLSGAALSLAGVTGGGNDLTLDFSADTTLTGALLTGIDDLAVGGGGNTIINGGTIATTGTQTYDDVVRLAGDVTLNGTTVTFNNTIDGTTAGAESLTIGGNAVFGNAGADTVGATTELEALSVSGNSTINASSIATSGAQSYSGAVTLGGAATLAGGSLTFGSTVSGGSDLTLLGDNVALGGTVNVGAQRLTIAARTSGGSINLGGADAVGVLGLSAAEVNGITAGTLQVGNGSSGPITISAAIQPLGVSTLSLVSGGSVTESGAGAITVANLEVTAGGSVTLLGNNDVDNLAGAVTGAGSFSFADIDDLTIGTVDGTTGIDTSSGAIRLMADVLQINQAVDAGTERVTIETFTPSVDVVLGTETLGKLSLTDAELDRITAGLLRIGNDPSLDSLSHRVNSILIDQAISLAGAKVPILSLWSLGNIEEIGAGSISVNQLAIRSGGLTLAMPGNNAVLALAIDSPNAVPIFVNTTGNPNVTTLIDGIQGIGGTQLDVRSASAQAQASLSNVDIPLPKQSTVDFGSGGLETVPPNLPPGSIWTSYLQVPFPKSDKGQRIRKVEDASKFMSGALSVLGSTAGPQSGR